MFDPNDIEIIEVDDNTESIVNDSSTNNNIINNEYSSNNDSIRELNDIRNRLLIQSQEKYSNKEINYEPFFDGYRLSEPGTRDIYVKINTTDKFNIHQIYEIDINELASYDNAQNHSDLYGGENKGRSLTKSTAIGRAMSSRDDSQAAFTNILFFIFLSGLSVGVVFMVILNLFI